MQKCPLQCLDYVKCSYVHTKNLNIVIFAKDFVILSSDDPRICTLQTKGTDPDPKTHGAAILATTDLRILLEDADPPDHRVKNADIKIKKYTNHPVF